MTLSAAVFVKRLGEILPTDQVSVDPRALQSNSEDYYWYSNVLDEDLAGYRAEVVAWPLDTQQLAGILAAAYQERVPVTIRGGGTGNYGQCVPLHGGLVLNLSRMNAILDLQDGWARVQAGVKFVELDQAAHATGQEIRIYPSTYLTATVAGFVGGGSAGVGSITHGAMVDGNVLATTVYPLDGDPRPISVAGAELALYAHAYGTTGVMADVTVPLTPRRSWEQAVFSFGDIVACHEFCLTLIDDSTIDKRLVTSAEPGVVRHFGRSRLPFSADRTAALLMFGAGQLTRVQALAERLGGQLDFVLPLDTKTRLSDFAWNHTTLWAKKSDPSLTYLQAGFDVRRYPEQVRAIRAKYGDEIAIHGEYFRSGGRVFAGSLPIIPFKGREHLDRMVDFLESINVGIANPHRYLLEEGSHVENLNDILAAKRQNDPAGLLNPGKLRALLAPGEARSTTHRVASMSLARQHVD